MGGTTEKKKKYTSLKLLSGNKSKCTKHVYDSTVHPQVSVAFESDRLSVIVINYTI